jgi:hypothetical protein
MPTLKRRRVAADEGVVTPVTGLNVVLQHAWSAVTEPLEGCFQLHYLSFLIHADAMQQ